MNVGILDMVGAYQHTGDGMMDTLIDDGYLAREEKAKN